MTVGERFQPAGDVFFTTVRQDTRVNGWEYLEANIDGDIVLFGEDEILGDRSPGENRAFNLELMQVSKSTAVAVAFRHLGIDPYEATGVGMAGVEGPSEGILTTDDVIVAVDGTPVRTADDLVAEIRARVPGQVVRLDVVSVDEEVDDDPRTVEVVPGTIGFEGAVGPIGGIAQKTVAAREGGVDLFLVPAEEYEVAARHAGNLQVEPVATLEEALAVLAGLGGNALDLRVPGAGSAVSAGR